MGHFTSSSIGIFGIKWSEKIPEMRSPKISQKEAQVMTQGHMKRWRGATPEAEGARIFTGEDLRGLKASNIDLKES
jgi:hypothetical protein